MKKLISQKNLFTTMLILYRAYYYCELCHKDTTDLNKIKKCNCTRGWFLFTI